LRKIDISMNVEITKLATGLTVVTDPMPQLESAALGVWVNTGGRNETKPVMGVSHMLEHMAFKGTERRTARQIAEEIEAVGGFMNAYTSREQTAFHMRTLKADVPLAIDILADILMHPTLEQAELERERQVVLQEIGQARDTPDDIVFDHLQSVAFPDQPMGWPILGNEDTVSHFGREHLQTYMGANYRASSMVFVASGAMHHAQVVDLVGQHFGGVAAGEAQPPQPARYAGGDMRVAEDLEQVHVAYAFLGVSNTDPDFYVSQVYAAALGGGMSSRLFQEAREKRGLCYSIYAFGQSFSDGGVIGVYAGTGEAEAAEISGVIADEMAALAANATEQEIARAKAQMKSGLLMGLERPATRAEQIAGQLFTFGRVIPVEELTAKLDAVDAAAVRRFGERVMRTARPSLAVVGPHNSLEDYDRFAGRFGADAVRQTPPRPSPKLRPPGPETSTAALAQAE
jgi:predicted Zn-dependent peptidase